MIFSLLKYLQNLEDVNKKTLESLKSNPKVLENYCEETSEMKEVITTGEKTEEKIKEMVEERTKEAEENAEKKAEVENKGN